MSETVFQVACLCAAWCRLCDDYAPVFDRVISDLREQGARVERHWIDIEDEAELLGDFDVETFPTLVVMDGDLVRFAGPLTPQPDTLHRLLRAVVVDAGVNARWPAVTPEVQAFATRFQARDGVA